MAAPRYDVLGIGNAIVDVIARAEDDFLVAQGMHKGGMALIDEARAAGDLRGHGAGDRKLRRLGRQYHRRRRELRRAAPPSSARSRTTSSAAPSPTTSAPPASPSTSSRRADGPSTARCYIMVTPDGERTMNTYLGAAQDLKPADIDETAVADAAVVYLEGYLWDPPQAKEAFVKAAAIAHKAGRRVALTLSDSFCVDRYRAEFLDLIRKGTVDIVFANEHELHSLYETADFDTAVQGAARDAKLAVVTRSEKAAWWSRAKGSRRCRPCRSSSVVDVTGAGDLFAAGFLVGLARGKDHRTAARLGALAAAEVIQHIGARPAVSLKALAAENGLAGVTLPAIGNRLVTERGYRFVNEPIRGARPMAEDESAARAPAKACRRSRPQAKQSPRANCRRSNRRRCRRPAKRRQPTSSAEPSRAMPEPPRRRSRCANCRAYQSRRCRNSAACRAPRFASSRAAAHAHARWRSVALAAGARRRHRRAGERRLCHARQRPTSQASTERKAMQQSIAQLDQGNRRAEGEPRAAEQIGAQPGRQDHRTLAASSRRRSPARPSPPRKPGDHRLDPGVAAAAGAAPAPPPQACASAGGAGLVDPRRARRLRLCARPRRHLSGACPARPCRASARCSRSSARTAAGWW